MKPKRKRKRTTTRRRPPAKRQRRMTYGQVEGFSPGLIVGIGKTGYGITKPWGIIKPREPSKLPKNADVKWDKANGNAKQVNRLIVLSCKKRIKRPSWAWTRVSWKMVRGPNGRRHRYVSRIRRRRRGLQRGGVLPMLAMALSPWAFKKKKRHRRARRR